jgi:hypothetical protein
LQLPEYDLEAIGNMIAVDEVYSFMEIGNKG